MRKAGATPKLTMSTRLSSSAPNRVPVFERRATRPSSASRMPAKKMYHPARSNSPRDASTIDHTPKNRLKSVNRLGTTITTRRMLGRGKRRMFMGSPRSPAVLRQQGGASPDAVAHRDRKSTRLNSSHSQISYAVFCLKKKKINNIVYTLPHTPIYKSTYTHMYQLH